MNEEMKKAVRMLIMFRRRHPKLDFDTVTQRFSELHPKENDLAYQAYCEDYDTWERISKLRGDYIESEMKHTVVAEPESSGLETLLFWGLFYLFNRH